MEKNKFYLLILPNDKGQTLHDIHYHAPIPGLGMYHMVVVVMVPIVGCGSWGYLLRGWRGRRLGSSEQPHHLAPHAVMLPSVGVAEGRRRVQLAPTYAANFEHHTRRNTENAIFVKQSFCVFGKSHVLWMVLFTLRSGNSVEERFFHLI